MGGRRLQKCRVPLTQDRFEWGVGAKRVQGFGVIQIKRLRSLGFVTRVQGLVMGVWVIQGVGSRVSKGA